MDKTKKQIIDDYVEYRSLSSHEPNKRKDIKRNAEEFINYNKSPLTNYGEKILIEYLKSIDKYSINTQNDKKADIKNLIKWYFADWSSRFRNLERICKTQQSESPYKSEDMISESDFEKLISIETSIFWKAYFSMLFYGCCRPSELFLLKWNELDMSDKDGGIFFNIFSKKNKRTFLKYLPANASYFVKQLQNNNSEYVFINPSDNKLLNRQKAYYEINKISKKALGKEIDLYTLRHSIATINYNKENVKDDIIAMQMGHSKSMKGTYTHNDKNKLKANAKNIYMGEMPPERKHELENEIEMLKKKLEDYILKVDGLLQDGYSKKYDELVGDKFEQKMKEMFIKKNLVQ